MGKQSILTLSAMQTMAGRVIRDIKNGGKRELRNALELFRNYARTPQQQDFWNVMKGFLTSSETQYQALLQRTTLSVKEDTLKAVTINLSCNAFSAGRDILYKNALNHDENRWIQWLHPSADIQKAVDGWVQKGVFVFLVNVQAYKGYTTQLAELAAHNSRCVFIYVIYTTAELDFSWVVHAIKSANICVLLAPDLIPHYAPWLLKHKLLFGVIRDYAHIENPETEYQLLQQWICAGCLLGVYHSTTPSHNPPHEAYLYRTLKRIRCKGQMQILLCDLDEDTAMIQDILLGRQKIPDFSSFSF